MKMGDEYILEIRQITKQFPGVLALDDVSLSVRPGTVHALMGENGAGKSTLMNCLLGIYHFDRGEIFLKGRDVRFHSTKNALDAGISMIHQELSNVPKRTVAQNLWLGREPVNRLGLIDHRKMKADTEALMRDLNIDVRADCQMDSLSISKQQSCEIAKAVSYGASVVVMDEPTSSLTEAEVEHLFKIINDLRSRGVAVIYITHKMSEIFHISDEVSVMRDGKMVGTYRATELNEDRLISLMVGRTTNQRYPSVEAVPGKVRLSVKNLTSTSPKSFKDISFDLRESEILGIGGLVGAQRTELVEAIFGLRGISAGQVTLDGNELRITSPKESIKHGLSLITEDRRGSGIFPLLSITTNTAIAALDDYRKWGIFLMHSTIQRKSRDLNESLRTKTPSMHAQIQNLSGGNQQKVIVSRWLMTVPDILIMDEPTRGIDVGAKYEIYTIMAELVRQGKSIIMVSSEMPELIGMSHRIMVLCAGRKTGILEKNDMTQENIMRLATTFSLQE
jgi:methyl-galactoside transport system ATP-binding protein